MAGFNKNYQEAITANNGHSKAPTVRSYDRNGHGNLSSPLSSDNKSVQHISPKSSTSSRGSKQPNSTNTSKEEDNRNLSSRPIRIFVGTWNCAYQDPEESVILKPGHGDKDHWTSRMYRPAKALYQVVGYLYERVGQIYTGGITQIKAGITRFRRSGCHNLPNTSCEDLPSTTRQIRFMEPSKDVSSDEYKRRSTKNSLTLRALVSPRSLEIESSNMAPKDNITSYKVHLPIKSRYQRCRTNRRESNSRNMSHADNYSSVRLQRDAIQRRIALNSRSKTLSRIKVLSRPQSNPNGDVTSTVVNLSKDPNTSTSHSGGTTGSIGPDFIAPSLRMRRTTMHLKPLTDNDNEPLSDWIPMGYDIYIISLQETLSCSMFVSITKYLRRQSDEEFVRIELDDFKLSGYGDGAFLQTKSTSIAVWVRKSLLDSSDVKIGPSKSIPLSRINRSKGMVSFQMVIFGQVIGIVGCHLPTDYHAREKAIPYMLKKLADLYGYNGASLDEIFHHILWTGDFNFRVTNISTKEALILLNSDRVQELFYHDEYYKKSATMFSEMKFEEGVVRFFPTYKMRDDREVADHSHDNWAESAYHTRYETHWYKGGNIKDRVPSWTDRVFKWSVPELRTCLLIDELAYRAAQPSEKNILLTSDHTPVGCGFALWPVNKEEKIHPRKNLFIT
ncbi:endonuclease exonuclease phosphatase family protein [Babesia ovis]|uniref:Endonuclease exonuclease phosphatase family protein n=1 Tax=Babesia ovis TaxID=5869 RepID=A0A9W5WUW3_BABOV|nr:endonuclease exonuclease phosphatase family protein [Babesia ovis]